MQGGKNTKTFNIDGIGERRGGGFGTFGSVDYYNDGITFIIFRKHAFIIKFHQAIVGAEFMVMMKRGMN